MARTVICMVIMAVLTAASIGAAIYTDTRCIIDEVISSEGEGSQGQITESLDSLEREWDKSYKGFSFIAQREMINDISFELSQLRERYTRGSDDFIAECRGVRDRLIRLREIL